MLQEDPLVRVHYSENETQYADVRRYHTSKGINKRRVLLQQYLKRPSLTHKQRCRWSLENALLLFKHRIYFERGIPAPIAALRMILQCTDRHGYERQQSVEQARQDKELHLLPLLNLLALRPDTRRLMGMPQAEEERPRQDVM
jgi:hypothetical protein